MCDEGLSPSALERFDLTQVTSRFRSVRATKLQLEKSGTALARLDHVYRGTGRIVTHVILGKRFAKLIMNITGATRSLQKDSCLR